MNPPTLHFARIFALAIALVPALGAQTPADADLSAKGADARHETAKELASSSRGAPDTATVLRESSKTLNRAYQALAQKDYDSAIDLFRKGLAAVPKSQNQAHAAPNLSQSPEKLANIHKDLAYTLLKAGENSDARDEFEAAMRLNPPDETAALEFAFLAFETKKPIEARRIFDRLRHSGTPATRATAEQAFENIDNPLASGIARWQQALAQAPNPNDISTFSAHWELAQLAELRDELPLAAEQFQICRQLKPQLPEILLILGRVWGNLGRADDAHAAWLAASRSPDSRTAELALEHLDSRYPYPYEFLNALKLDPDNIALRRELAYLYLAMHDNAKAIEQFAAVLKIDPHDELSRRQLDALRGSKPRAGVPPPSTQTVAKSFTGASAVIDPKGIGLKSLKLGYLHDASKYLRQAHEQNPDDAQVTIALAWAYNLSKDNADALPLFNQARYSDDPQIAAEATKAFHVLNGDTLPETTFWSLSMFSTRWMDAFDYSQLKRTVPLPWKNVNKLVSFYISARLMGDARGQVSTAFGPGYLSESSLIAGIGAASKTWHHLTGWVEAGESMNYIPGRTDEGLAIPDYRGGLNFAKGFGSLLGSKTSGYFYETTGDAIYVSRFEKDWMFYSQHRGGRTFHLANTTFQALLNINYVTDAKSLYWANSLETGPGLKLHLPWMRPNVYLSADFLHGFYLRGDYYPPCAMRGCPPESAYNDLRISFWYAFTKTQ